MSVRERYEQGEEPELMSATLGELRNELALGIFSGGVRRRDFRLRDFSSGHDFDIADLREKNRALSPPATAHEVMAVMTESVGGVRFDSMSIDERKLFLRNMSLPDVQQMYVALRRLSVGDDLVASYICPGCNKRRDPHYSIEQIEVLTLEAADDKPIPARVAWFIPLQDGATFIRGGEEIRVTGVWMQVIPWGIIVDLPGLPTASARKRELLRYSIYDTEPSIAGAAGTAFITDEEMAKFSFIDLAKLQWHYENNTPGIQLVLKTPKCPDGACGLSVSQPLNWNFDTFFAYWAPTPIRKKKFSPSSSSSPSAPKAG